MKSYGVTIQMKAPKQYFPVILFVVLTVESVDKIWKWLFKLSLALIFYTLKIHSDFFLLNANSSTFQIESVKWSHSSKQLYFDESMLFILSYTSQFYPFYSDQKVILPSGLQPSNLELTFSF